MATKRLTQLTVEKMTPPKTGRIEVFDAHLPGFGLRVSASGFRSWFVFYRVNGVQRRHTVGSIHSHPKVEDAREAARAILRDVARGIDPAAQPAKTEAPAAAQVVTVADLAAEFIAKHAREHNKRPEATDGNLRLHVLPRWSDRPATEITARDVYALLDAVKKPTVPAEGGRPVGGHIAANRVMAAIGKMFAWGVRRHLVDKSPVAGVERPSKEEPRDRLLSDAELTAVYAAALGTGGVVGAYVRALVLTGQRRSEIAAMRWADIDLDRAAWTMPGSATKNGKPHAVPLSDQVLALLASLPRDGEYVFSTTGGRAPISGFSKLKMRIDAKSGVTDWHLHDLRHTLATRMAEHLKIDDRIIGRILNHTEKTITNRIYNRYDSFDEKAAALQAWADRVEPASAEVVELRA